MKGISIVRFSAHFSVSILCVPHFFNENGDISDYLKIIRIYVGEINGSTSITQVIVTPDGTKIKSVAFIIYTITVIAHFI